MSVPLTVIQKGKRCSIPPDLKRPSAGAPARTAAAAFLPSQHGCSAPMVRLFLPPRTQRLPPQPAVERVSGEL